MALEELTLTLNPNSGDPREYRIDMIDSVDISSTKEAFSIAPPGLAASENILLGISGMNADISISWSIHSADNQDKANATYSSQVVTIDEQVTYLEDVIQDPSFDATWELTHETGAAFNDDEVFLETIDMTPISNDSPKWTGATMRLRRGGSV